AFVGSDTPTRCMKCPTCGSSYFKDDKGENLPPESHIWVPRYDENTGERKKDRCNRCFINKTE
ncbi:MAG: hypothetical protein KGI08_10680, partial [Thaumarchaeota archaeon]|nr:hypothetical protein [Nitrososphaerota archaeon]